MSSKQFIAALTAVCLLAGGSVFARDSDHGRDRRDDRSQHDNGRHGGDRHDDDHGYDRGHDRDKHQPQWRDNGNRHGDERGAGPDHNFRRGGRLPVYYRSHIYVVDDWRGHRLSSPPRGYHWVQTGSDYVLVAIATGIIFQILLN